MEPREATIVPVSVPDASTPAASSTDPSLEFRGWVLAGRSLLHLALRDAEFDLR